MKTKTMKMIGLFFVMCSVVVVDRLIGISEGGTLFGASFAGCLYCLIVSE